MYIKIIWIFFFKSIKIILSNIFYDLDMVDEILNYYLL